MLKVGVTGGIGSGKTTVCRIFTTLGIPVYYADDRAKELMISDHELVAGIKNIFGEEAYEDGQLNRKLLSDKAFKDKSLLTKLNAVVHPAVFRDSINWFLSHEDKLYVLYEAAILFETGNNQNMDKVITVVAPAEDRIARIIARDAVEREEVLARIDKQLSDDEKIRRSDFVIHNDHSHSVVEQVLTIHEQLILLSGKN